MDVDEPSARSPRAFEKALAQKTTDVIDGAFGALRRITSEQNRPVVEIEMVGGGHRVP